MAYGPPESIYRLELDLTYYVIVVLPADTVT